MIDLIDYYYGWIRSLLQKHLNQRFSADQIVDGIYIGDFASSCNLEAMLSEGITHVLCVVNGAEPVYPEHFTYLNIHAGDYSWTPLEISFDISADFIQTCLDSGGKVLVHCMCGVSRSSTLVLAYLMKRRGYTLSEALNLVLSRRPQIKPNFGFLEKLSHLPRIEKFHS